MSYAEREESVDNGALVEFVRFAIGVDRVYRYTSALTVQTHAGEEYEPIFLDRSSPAMSPEIEQNKLTIKMPRDVAIADLFKKNAPSRTVWIAYYRRHEGDVVPISYWQGRVSAVQWVGDMAELTCDSLESMLRRQGLRPMYQPTCRHFLYDGRCPVPEAAFKTSALVQSVNGDTLVSPAFASKPNGWFTLGFVDTASFDSRFIIGHAGDTVTLIAPFEASPLGQTVDAFAGCDQLHLTCRDKFGEFTDGGRDFGGSDLVPITNVFEKGLR